MALALESIPAGRWILRRCAGLALLLLTMAVHSAASLAEDQSSSFSATVMFSQKASSWCTMPTPAASASRGLLK